MAEIHPFTPKNMPQYVYRPKDLQFIPVLEYRDETLELSNWEKHTYIFKYLTIWPSKALSLTNTPSYSHNSNTLFIIRILSQFRILNGNLLIHGCGLLKRNPHLGLTPDGFL